DSSTFSESVHTHPSEVGVHWTALQLHRSAGPGHDFGAQHRVRGYTAGEHVKSFGGPSVSHEHAKPCETNDSLQCVALVPVRVKHTGAQRDDMHDAMRDGGTDPHTPSAAQCSTAEIKASSKHASSTSARQRDAMQSPHPESCPRNLQ